MVKLYDSAFATCPRKARLAFEEKGAPYTRETLNPLVWTRDPSHPLRKVSPDGLLPLLEVDGKFLRESTVICEYVDEAFDGPALMPEDPFERGQVRLWMKRIEVDCHIPHHMPFQFAVALMKAVESFSPESRAEYFAANTPRRRAVLEEVYENGFDSVNFRNGVRFYDQLFGEMEAALSETPWLVGQNYSLAEVGVAPWVYRITQEFGYADLYFQDRPHLGPWFDRVMDRDGFRRAIFVEDPDDMPAKFRAGGDAARDVVAAILEESRTTAAA